MGLDFLAHPFWDKFLDFEERVESQDHVFAILSRVIHIPMHQYARYFERYRTMAASRPLEELAPQSIIVEYRQTAAQEGGSKQKTQQDIDQEVRTRLDGFHLEIFNRTQAETTKRWTYESEIKRPYYHVTDLDEPQLTNWKKYLDFEEEEGDYIRTKFLYERCLVTTANYEELWMRYARWMLAQTNKPEEVRSIFQRASCLYVPIGQPSVRFFWAQFEEAEGRPDTAAAIYAAVAERVPNHIEAVISLANVYRRQHGLQAAIEILEKYVNSTESTVHTRGALISEWARLLWKVKGSPNEARKIYLGREHVYQESQAFWVSWLDFEMQQPTSEKDEAERYQRVKAVFDNIRNESRLPPELIKEIATTYFAFLKERGGKDAMREYMQLDRELYGPATVDTTTTVNNIQPSGAVAHQEGYIIEETNGNPPTSVP